MNKEQILELADRVEALDGPSREVDAEIWAALGNCNHERTERYACQDDTGFTCLDCGVDTYGAKYAPKFTSSIDAGMTLVLSSAREWHTGKHFKGGGVAYILCGLTLRDPIYVVAATPALALCAAALRAKAETL